MEIALAILRWFALLPGLAVLAFWLILVIRVLRTRATVPGVRDGLDAAANCTATVSVIIPAHNEEHAIANCARRLAAQDYSHIQFVFVLDRCTDATRAHLEETVGDDSRFVIIENDSCPEDWAGKCHAAHLGAEQATGDWLIFTDADTEFDPRLVRAALGMAIDRKLSLLSLLSTLSHETWFERIVQPVASLNLIRMFPINQVNRPESRRNFANGQFMLFTRAIYDTIGGHEAVKNDLLEDIAFARLVRRSGGAGGVFFDDGMLRVQMYASYDAFRNGWKRIFIEACKRHPSRLRKNARRAGFMAIGVPLILAATLALSVWFGIDGAWGQAVAGVFIVLVALFLRCTGLAIAYGLSGAPMSASLSFERGSWHLRRIFHEAARDVELGRPIQWGGLDYVLEPGSAH